MATTHTNTAAGCTDQARTTAGGTAATIRNTEDKPQQRTILMVVAGVIILGLIIWFATRDNNAGDMNQMNLPNTENVRP